MDWTIVSYILCGIGGYLIGSISPALIICDHLGAKKDVRNYGSGNAGTTNMIRTFGVKLGIMTFLLDVIKGLAVALIARLVAGDIGLMIAGICAVAGHNWPIYYGFRGGKGIASTIGVMAVLMPPYTPVILVIALILVAITGYVSVGSIVGVILCAAASLIFYFDRLYIVIAVCVLAVFALFGHRANMKRLIHGNENKLTLRKNKEKPSQ